MLFAKIKLGCADYFVSFKAHFKIARWNRVRRSKLEREQALEGHTSNILELSFVYPLDFRINILEPERPLATHFAAEIFKSNQIELGSYVSFNLARIVVLLFAERLN